jgi:YD repeat-containing protein
LLVWTWQPHPVIAQVAIHYVYDDLNRLIAVVDQQGNAATYTYDAVGNILRIERFDTGGIPGPVGITLVSPSKGKVGTTVQIFGKGFIATPSENSVAFNGTPAAVTESAPNRLVTAVPTGATTGPVTVTNANGTATSPEAFTVLVPATITGVEPNRVRQGATTQLVISGSGLAEATDVTFAHPGLTATILPDGTAESLPIDLTVAATVPAGLYTFSVTTPGGTAESGTITVTVTPPVPSFTVARPLSVFKLLPAQVAPSGSSFSGASLGVSVFMPGPAQVAPTGSSFGVAPLGVSVGIPGSEQVSPSGPSFSVAPGVSVEMPE